MNKFEINELNLPIVGAICGDILGSGFEWHPVKNLDMELCDKDDTFTDDTVCTLAVAEALWNHTDVAESLRMWCRCFKNAGYGGTFRRWIWIDDGQPYNSWGNGSAMRASAAGAFAGSLEEALELARISAEPTHNHPEGVKGAQATAAAIYLAKTGASKEEIKEYVAGKFGYDLDRRYEDIQPAYDFDVSCQGSVPESIICFLESRDYEDTIRHAIAMGGDADTMACIAGGIAAAYYREIPERLLEHCMECLVTGMGEGVLKVLAFGKEE